MYVAKCIVCTEQQNITSMFKSRSQRKVKREREVKEKKKEGEQEGRKSQILCM